MKWGGKTAHGFTIVETLIVLAVSSVLLGSAVLLINGRQNRTQFQTAINDLQQQLQQIINQTTSGYYQNKADFKCRRGTPPTIDGGTNSQGTNGGCIFLGTVLYFGPGQPTTTFSVYPIAGNRLDNNGAVASTVPAAWPTAIAPGTATNLITPDDHSSYTMEGGLTYYGSSSATPNAPLAIGVITSLGSDASSTNILTGTGAQQFRLYGFSNNWAAVTSPSAIVDKINTATTAGASAFKPWPNALNACISSGTTNQSAFITVSQGLQVTMQIKDNKTCA